MQAPKLGRGISTSKGDRGESNPHVSFETPDSQSGMSNQFQHGHHVAVTVGFTPTSPLVLCGALFTYATLTMFGVTYGIRTHDPQNHNLML